MNPGSVTIRARQRRHVPALAFGSVIVLCLAYGTTAARAQDSRVETDAGSIDRRIEEQDRQSPDRPPAATPLPERRGAPAPAAEEENFILSAVTLTGVTAFPAAKLAEAYEEFLASNITLAQAELIANRITEIYREAGYVLSRAFVPPQTIATGVLQVAVVEGSIVSVVTQGDGAAALDAGGYAAALQAERPLTLETLERNILLINGLAGISVDRSDVKETAEGSGEFILTLTLSYDALDGTAYTDNRGTPAVGRVQSWTAAGLNSALGMGERFQIGVFTVPFQPQELVYVEGDYTQPLGADGLEAALTLSHSEVDGGSDLSEVDTESTSDRVQVRLSYPLIRARQENLWLNGLFEARNTREDRQGTENFDDRLRIARIRVNYLISDEETSNSAIVMISQGLSVLGASNERSGPLSRFDGRAEFTKVNAEFVHTRTLFGDWSAQLSATGQKSANSLLSSEEFAVGGARFGRAYDYAEISGEDGAAGSAEVRYTVPDTDGFVSFAQIYGFYDIGAVWNRNATGTFRRHSVSSAGGGIRINLPWEIRTSFEIAQPLTRQVDTSGNDTSPRYFFSLSADF